MEFVGLWVVIIFGSNPGASNAQLADGLAIMWKRISFFVKYLDFQARHGQPGLGNIFELMIFGEVDM